MTQTNQLILAVKKLAEILEAPEEEPPKEEITSSLTEDFGISSPIPATAGGLPKNIKTRKNGGKQESL